MRLPLDATVRAVRAAVAKGRAHAAETGRSTNRRSFEAALPERGELDVLRADDDVSRAVAVSPCFKQRVVLSAGQLRLRERGWKLQRIRVGGVAVVPVGKRPVRGPLQILDDHPPKRPFQGRQVAAMPREEIPGLVLTLLPELRPVGRRWRRIGRRER